MPVQTDKAKPKQRSKPRVHQPLGLEEDHSPEEYEALQRYLRPIVWDPVKALAKLKAPTKR